jgi:flavin-binding protein dodecin
MAFKLTKLEKVLATAVGLDIARPGTSRAAFTRAAQAAVAVVPRVAPPVARGAAGVGRAALGAGATFARRNPVVATGLGAAALQQAGAFDPIEEEIRSRVDDAVQRAMAPIETARRPDVQQAAVRIAKRKVSKYSKSVKAGMAAVKKSKFGGKPGKITNAKKAFATVNKVASAVNKGKKVAKTGIRGVAARAIKGILKR